VLNWAKPSRRLSRLRWFVFQGEHNVAKRTDKGRVMPRLTEKVAFLERDTLVSGWLSLRS
jgi:hypothetical protein